MNYPKNYESAKTRNYKFWKTQPMMKYDEKISIDGPYLDPTDTTELQHKNCSCLMILNGKLLIYHYQRSVQLL